MALYHYRESSLSRSQGRSACAAVAYITKEDIVDDRTGFLFFYESEGHDVTFKTLAPEGAPEWAKEVQTLWNRVEAFEDEIAEDRFKGHPHDEDKNERSLRAREAYKSSAVTAHQLIIALPLEFSRTQNEEAVKRYLEQIALSKNMCATYGIH